MMTAKRKPTKKTKPKRKSLLGKPSPNQQMRCPTYLGPGRFCNREFRYADGFELESGKVVCPDCSPRTVRPMKKDKPDMLWYVMTVEPGKDVKARKDFLRRAKSEGCKDVGRVMIPRRFQEKEVPPAGKVLAEGTEKFQRDAIAAAEQRACQLAGGSSIVVYGSPENSAWRDYYRTTAFMNEKTGKFDWKVRTREKPVRRVVKVKKYPGYVLVQCKYGTEVAELVKRTKHAWGLLLEKVHPDDIRVSVSESKHGGYRWRVTNPRTKEVLAKGRADVHPLAVERARYAKESLLTFKPVALETKEAAEEVIAQKAINQISKDKEELYKVHVDIRVGNRVAVNDPTWKGVEGEVLSIDKKDKTNPRATLAVEVMGTKIRITVAVTDCKTI